MIEHLEILVVDDDVDNAASLGELLELEGHAVTLVHSGEAAIQATLQNDFNISFMDVVMPGMSGVESFLHIRRAKPHARVYMMTGYSVEQLLTQALEGGALGVLEKPFDPESILSLVSQVGPQGLVLAAPEDVAGKGAVGKFIHDTINHHGMQCCHVTDEHSLKVPVSADAVVLLDMPEPLIDGVKIFKELQAAGHRGQTVLVPHSRSFQSSRAYSLTDVAVTGILNKPFDPLELLNRLPQLVA
jgi:two-component system, NtrC family, response regulator HydG